MKKAIERLQNRKENHRQMNLLVRIIWATGGFVVLGAGIAMLVLPGPGLLVMAAGLAMLALEFAWAERLLEKSLQSGARVGKEARSRLKLIWIMVIVLATLAVLFTLGAWKIF